MTTITITARGPQRSGKTRTIVALLSAARQMGLFDGEGLKVGEVVDAPSDGTVERITFAVPDRAGIDQAIDAIEVRRGIFGEIDSERRYQTEKWGIAADDTLNTPWMWTAYITQYATKWLTGIFTTPTPSVDLFRISMIKVASIAIAAVESLDRQRAAKGRAFYETEGE